jgi:hypothetical protein
MTENRYSEVLSKTDIRNEPFGSNWILAPRKVTEPSDSVCSLYFRP